MSKLEFEGDDGDGEEYEVQAICDSAVYARESEGHLPGLYYLVSCKSYPEEKNTGEPASVIQHLRRLISNFHKELLEKPTATSPPTDSALTMAGLLSSQQPSLSQRLQPSNKSEAGLQGPVALTSKQKRAELSIFALALALDDLPTICSFSPTLLFQFIYFLVFSS